MDIMSTEMKWNFVDSCCSDVSYEYEMFHLKKKEIFRIKFFIKCERNIRELLAVQTKQLWYYKTESNMCGNFFIM